MEGIIIMAGHRVEIPPEQMEKFLERSYLKALTIFLTDFTAYVLCVIGALFAEHIILNLLFSLAAGWFILPIFVAGHDACHGAFTDSPKLNRLIGTIAFLPSLHPFFLWANDHHGSHHRYTNLAGKGYDHAWAPFSKEQFDKLPRHRQWLERFYRSSYLFHGFGYMANVWWKKLFFPRPSELGGYKKGFMFDNVVLGLFLVFVIAGNVYLSESGIISQPWWSALLFSFIIPSIIIFNWAMGLCVFLHHNNPNVRWYNDYDEWFNDASQLENTVHAVFPGIANKLFHNMMEHCGHHINQRIPCYNLLKVQNYLEETKQDRVTVIHWSRKVHAEMLKSCQLYDYDNHKWLTFDGEVAPEFNPEDYHETQTV